MQRTIELFRTKEGVSLEDMKMLHPNLLILWTATILYCSERNLPCIMNSLVNDREAVTSISKTHEEGRAFDMSSINPKNWTGTLWDKWERLRFVNFMNANYGKFGAYSKSDGKQRVVIFGDSRHLNHFHVQCKRDTVDDILLHLSNVK